VNGNFVIAAWVKNPSTVGNAGQPAILYNAGGGDGYRFGVTAGGIYALGGFPYVEALAVNTFLANVWYHAAVVYDRMGLETGAPRLTYYLNGVHNGWVGMTYPQTRMTTAVPGIVRNPHGGSTYTGKLGMLTAYKGHATAAEIQQLFASQRGRYGV
jgi:hypothetical protein